ncbi:MAG: hypothetical protein MUC65_08790 [Pontiellaceae bacterium]|jgi:hypothetical protein|nr:hypothetical protein [Pontiellaceae bacterium]
MKFRSKYKSHRETVFESFSDMVLCVVIVLVTLIVTLALNVQREVPVNNLFTGGIGRPQLFLQAGVANTAVPVSGSPDDVMVHLFSPSAAAALTRVENGRVTARNPNQTFSGQLDFSAWQFLQLASGVEPGRFQVEGADTSLMLPEFVSKVIIHSNGFREVPDLSLALEVMKLAWPVYRKPIYPVRSSGEFSGARTRVYIETMTRGDARYIYIGHMMFKIPEEVQNGSLSWLEGLTSGLTELVFLGEMWSDPEIRTDKRIAFFDAKGYSEAAEACRRFTFDWSAADQASARKEVSSALMEGRAVNPARLPPFLAYPEAWAAYVEDCRKIQRSPNTASEIPAWFRDEFLRPLSFTRRVIAE